MRFTQPLLVLGLTILIASLGIAFVAFRSGNSNRDAMLGALRHGLERAYDQAIAGTPRPNQASAALLPASALPKALLDEKEQRLVLPSFVNSQDVFLGRKSVPIPSDQLIYVVRFGDVRLY